MDQILARKKVLGNCHICGNYGSLSFEHVPPRAAFNNRPIILKRGLDLINSDLDNLKGEIKQKGSGDHTLCPKCNNSTGRWYAKDFAEWAYQGMRILSYTKGKPSIYYTFHIFPLRVIKQVITMFFSANSLNFRNAYPELVRFVLNKEANHLDEKFKIYCYYNTGTRSRQLGLAVAINTVKRTKVLMSEIAYPPMGYLLTISSPPPDPRLLDITFMSNYRYNDWKNIPLRLPILPIYTYHAGDYRDKDTVMQQSE